MGAIGISILASLLMFTLAPYPVAPSGTASQSGAPAEQPA